MRIIKNETDKALSVNNRTYLDYLNRLEMLATSLFKWENLDKVAGFGASRFLESSLYQYGKACFVKDKTKGFMVLNANPSDKLNIYYLPEKINAWSMDYNKMYPLDEVVYIMNNNMCLPTKDSITLFAYRLYDNERVMDTNLNALRTPVLIEGDTKSALTLKNLYMKYEGNEPFIFGNKDFQISNKLNVLKTDAPYLLDKLESHKHELWNDAMTYLGIDNANTSKKERLITDEVESNNELINYYLGCFYNTRKQACDMINEMFLKDSDIKIELKLNTENIKNIKQDLNNDSDGDYYE